MSGHARLRCGVRAVSASLARAPAAPPLAARSLYCAATRLQRGATQVVGRRSTSQSATKAYLDGLCAQISCVHSPEDLESFLPLIDRAPTPALAVDGWKAVIEALNSRRDQRLLRVLFDAPNFRPWMRRVGSFACEYLLRMMFYGESRPSITDVQELLEQLKTRGGATTYGIRRAVTEGFHRLGVSIPNSLVSMLAVETQDSSLRSWEEDVKERVRSLRENQGQSMRSVVRQIQPLLGERSFPAQAIVAVMGRDVYKLDDVAWMTAELGLQPDSHVWSSAVQNALHVTSGTTAAIELFQHARAQGVPILRSAAQLLLKCIVGDASFRIPHPTDLQIALDIFWWQMWRPHPDDIRKVTPVTLLGQLCAALAMPQRWTKVDSILAFLKANDLPLYTGGRPEHQAVAHSIYRSRSHAAALSGIRCDLLPQEHSGSVHAALHMRFDDAPIVPYEDYRTFLEQLEAHGRTLDDALVRQYVQAVFHSLSRLRLRGEQQWLQARGLSAAVYQSFARQNLLQLEKETRRDRPSLVTTSLRVALLGAYSRCDSDHVSRLWEEVCAAGELSDLDLRRALSGTRSHAQLCSMWHGYIASYPRPSADAWATFADNLCGLGAHEQAFAVIRDELGDGSPHRKPAIVLFASAPQDDLERYARALPKTWRDTRTREEVETLREHRRAQGKHLFPQTYDFVV